MNTSIFKRFTALVILMVVISSMVFGSVAEAKQVNTFMPASKPVFANFIFDAIEGFFEKAYADYVKRQTKIILYPVVSSVLTDRKLSDYLTYPLNDQVDAANATLFNPLKDDPIYVVDRADFEKQNRIQYWFDLLTVAGAAVFPLLLVRIAIMYITSFVNPERRGELKKFATNVVLYIAILLFARPALLFAIQLNEAIVDFFNKQYYFKIDSFDSIDISAMGLFNIIIGGLVMLYGLIVGLYIWLTFFIRKIMIGFTYLLLPIGGILMFTKQASKFIETLVKELIALVFQQAVYAGTFVILFDVIAYIVKVGAGLGAEFKIAAGSVLNGIYSTYGLLFPSVYAANTVTTGNDTLSFIAQLLIYTSNDGHGDTMLGPLGIAILLTMTIKVSKKFIGLLNLNTSITSNPEDVLNTASQKFKGFGEALASGKKFISGYTDEKGNKIDSGFKKIGTAFKNAKANFSAGALSRGVRGIAQWRSKAGRKPGTLALAAGMEDGKGSRFKQVAGKMLSALRLKKKDPEEIKEKIEGKKPVTLSQRIGGAASNFINKDWVKWVGKQGSAVGKYGGMMALGAMSYGLADVGMGDMLKNIKAGFDGLGNSGLLGPLGIRPAGENVLDKVSSKLPFELSKEDAEKIGHMNNMLGMLRANANGNEYLQVVDKNNNKQLYVRGADGQLRLATAEDNEEFGKIAEKERYGFENGGVTRKLNGSWVLGSAGIGTDAASSISKTAAEVKESENQVAVGDISHVDKKKATSLIQGGEYERVTYIASKDGVTALGITKSGDVKIVGNYAAEDDTIKNLAAGETRVTTVKKDKDGNIVGDSGWVEDEAKGGILLSQVKKHMQSIATANQITRTDLSGGNRRVEVNEKDVAGAIKQLQEGENLVEVRTDSGKVFYAVPDGQPLEKGRYIGNGKLDYDASAYSTQAKFRVIVKDSKGKAITDGVMTDYNPPSSALEVAVQQTYFDIWDKLNQREQTSPPQKVDLSDLPFDLNKGQILSKILSSMDKVPGVSSSNTGIANVDIIFDGARTYASVVDGTKKLAIPLDMDYVFDEAQKAEILKGVQCQPGEVKVARFTVDITDGKVDGAKMRQDFESADPFEVQWLVDYLGKNPGTSVDMFKKAMDSIDAQKRQIQERIDYLKDKLEHEADDDVMNTIEAEIKNFEGLMKTAKEDFERMQNYVISNSNGVYASFLRNMFNEMAQSGRFDENNPAGFSLTDKERRQLELVSQLSQKMELKKAFEDMLRKAQDISSSGQTVTDFSAKDADIIQGKIKGVSGEITDITTKLKDLRGNA